jgi:hypothetical protein
MLSAVMVICIVLGRHVEQRRRVIAAVEMLVSQGDYVEFSEPEGTDDPKLFIFYPWSDSGVPDSVVTFQIKTEDIVIALSEIYSIRRLVLRTEERCDEWIKHLHRLRGLRELYIECPHMTDNAVHYLTRLRSLQTMFVESSGLTSNGIERLRQALPSCEIKVVGESSPPAAPVTLSAVPGLATTDGEEPSPWHLPPPVPYSSVKELFPDDSSNMAMPAVIGTSGLKSGRVDQ